MKTYLNKDERERITLIAAGTGLAMDLVRESGDNMGKDERKYIKTASTFIQKYLDKLFDRVNRQEAEKIIKTLKTHRILMRPTKKAKREYEKDNKYLQLNEEEFYEWSMWLLDTKCKGCQFKKDKMENCKLRHIFFEHDLPKFEDEATTYCQYRMPKNL